MTLGLLDRIVPAASAVLLGLVLLATACLLVPPAAYAQVGFVPPAPVATDDGGMMYGAYLPTERTLVRGLGEAQQRIADGEYTAAANFLADVLGRDDDSFVALESDPTRFVGLKAAVGRLIAELPPEGLDAYELQQSAQAQRELDSAIQQGDYAAVGRVMREHFHTAAGCEAALLYAQWEFDHGHAAAAARIYRQLIETSQAAAQYQPQLTLLAATSAYAAGDHQQATGMLSRLVDRSRSGNLQVAGETRRLGDDSTAALRQLHAALASPPRGTPAQAGWHDHLGNVARNVSAPGGPPHMRARWKARVANHPRLESYLENRYRALTRSGPALIPVGSPLAVGNIVLFKTPQTVVAVDWQSGRRIWETRAHGDPELVKLIEELDRGKIDSDMAALGHPLDERIWDNRLAAALSSDGERVYTIRGLPFGDNRQNARSRRLQVFGGNMSIIGSLTNRLAAYDLATEGKLVWEIDGRRSRNQLFGAFFLGAPLALDDALYVLAEIRGAVYLLELDAETGALRWQQAIVNLERGVQLDLQRVHAGPSPSFADGILVCPTSAGAVVAIDLDRRALAWAHLYPRDDSAAGQAGRNWNSRRQSQSESMGESWSDGTALIDDGHVVLTPRDSSELLCLDLHTGEQLWQRSRDDGLFVGCVAEQTVVVVGQSGVTGLRLEDGEPRWNEQSDPMPDGARPSGRGFLSEGTYYLPTTEGAIVAVELATGEVRRATEPVAGAMLGNLICHRGAVVSQSPLTVDKFDQRSLLLEQTKAALARNESDPVALRDHGEIALAGGQLRQAVESLKQSYQVAPEDLLTRELLSEALVGLLKQDYAEFRQEVPLLRTLTEDPQQQFELLRLEADGLSDLGQPLAAFDVLIKLADSKSRLTDLVAETPDWQVRGDRWLQARLGRLRSEASAGPRKEIDAHLVERREAASDEASLQSLQQYLTHFDGLPGADGVRVEFARQLLARHDHQQAELAIDALADSDRESIRAAGAVLSLQLLEQSDSRGNRNYFAEQIDRKYRDVVSMDGRTAGQWLDDMQLTGADAESAEHNWNQQQLAAEEVPSERRRGRAARQTRNSSPSNRLRIEQADHGQIGMTTFFVSNDLGALVGRDRWGEESTKIELGAEAVNVPRRRNDREAVYAARLGHLLLVSLGTEIVALDTRDVDGSGMPSVLWRRPILARSSESQANFGKLRPGLGPYDATAGRRRLVGAQGHVFGSIGPLTAGGVALHDAESLLALDPLTGEVLWSRADVPPGCELFGDEELVFAKHPAEPSLSVFDMQSGRSRGERKVPAGAWLVAEGRNLATIQNSQQDAPQLVITNIETGEELYRETYRAGSKLRVDQPRYVGVVEPTGRFELVDVRTGTVVIDQPIEPEPRLRNFYMQRDQQRLYLATNHPAPRQPATFVSVDDEGFPLLSGNVYAFDLADGTADWSQPAEVLQQGIALELPPASPLLVFASRTMRQGPRGSESRLRVLCLDKATGARVYENDSIDDGPGGRFQVRAEPAEPDQPPTVVVETPVVDVRLTLSSEPRSQDDAESPEEPGSSPQDTESALWKLGGRIGRQMLEAIQEARPSDDAPAEPEQPGDAPSEEQEDTLSDEVHDD